MNWSLAFGVAQWDTIAILPAVTERDLSADDIRFAELAQRVIAGKDIGFVARTAGDAADPEMILQRWIEAEHISWKAIRSGTPGTG